MVTNMNNINSKMIVFLLLITNWQSAVCGSPIAAWWVDIPIDPICKSADTDTVVYEGISYKLLSKETFASIKEFREEDLLGLNAKFRTEFARHGAKKYYAAAVYCGLNKQIGRALLVSKEADFKQIVHAYRMQSQTGFSAIIVDKTKLLWMFCLYCSDYTEID